MRLFDTHTHLQDREFEDDRDDVLARAKAAGLEGIIALGTDVPSSVAALELARREPDVFAAAGCHPHDARSMDEASLARLDELAAVHEVVAVGEIGLDFYRDLSPREVQVAVLRRQLETATEVAKPVAVHCRQAHDELLPIMESWSQRSGRHLPDGRPLGVMHYFEGDLALAKRYLELGFLISIHTCVTYPKNDALREVAARLPLDALVVETDSPYGPPQSRRGQRNEPACVAEAVDRVAEMRGETCQTIAEATAENAARLFGLPTGRSVAAGAGRRTAPDS